ncbi:MAG: hypothetical protein EP347_05200 [Alphaproteobacteria bacterium]|nr:MAG: hypothetical protein EP347_05200 [Alphaproteobacteria bacterium]
MNTRKIISAFCLAAFLSPASIAEDWEALCLEEVKDVDIPPEISQEQIENYCSCYGAAISGNADLEAEIRVLLDLPREDRGAQASEALIAEEVTCREEALAP